MNKQSNIVRVGIAALLACVLVGMLFVPAVAAADYNVSKPEIHYGGVYVFNLSTTSAANVTVSYNDVSKTLYVENTTKGPATLGNAVLSIEGAFDLKNTDVELIEVDYDVALDSSNTNAFAAFTNAAFNYMNATAGVSSINVGGMPLYFVNATNSTVYIEALNNYTGKALVVDTYWAVPGQEVKLAVKALTNYSVYGWNVYDGVKIAGEARADSDTIIVPSTNPEDRGLFILTMPANAVTVSPKLRDSGSTYITYVFLNADTYVMEIPADFSLTGIGKTVDGKMVNITALDLLEGHSLAVTMNATNELNTSSLETPFQLVSVKERNAKAPYLIKQKAIYLDQPVATKVDGNGKVILNTALITAPSTTEDLIAAGNLKTELQFTLMDILNKNVIGKYKDKLTFTVGITEAKA